jgi:signal transduction histidine kinase
MQRITDSEGANVMRLSKTLQIILGWIKQRPVMIIAVGILGYYLATALDLFMKSGKTHLSPLDFILQFDSLIWMWIAAFVFVKLQKTKERFFGEQKEKLVMQHQLDKSKIASAILKQITRQLQDTINNPLAIIGVMTEDIRKRFLAEPEVMRRLDQIDASLRRIHNAIKDIATYQTTQVLEALQSDLQTGGSLSPPSDNGRDKAVNVVET